MNTHAQPVNLTIGKVYLIHRRPVLIESGCFYDPVYHRVSNFWYGRFVRKDGSIGRKWCGFGEDFPEIPSIVEKRVVLRRVQHKCVK
jgi:hypothetical protein